MSLRQWLENTWLEQHATTQMEIRSWAKKIERSLSDARTSGLSDDGRYLHAYNAALLIATSALAAEGYRPERRDSHHFRAFQSLEFTLVVPTKSLQLLDTLRKKRNQNIYDSSGAISSGEADEMLRVAEDLNDRAAHWFKEKHSELL